MVASRRKLKDEASHLTRQIDEGATFRKERELKSELSRVEWPLSAYPQSSTGGNNK